MEDLAEDGMKSEARELFTVIMDISKQLQQQLLSAGEEPPMFPSPDFDSAKRVGCQGCAGANSETAIRTFFPDREPLYYPSFHQVFEAVESGEITYGVLPIYNSTAGSVTQTYDLMGKYNFFITAMNQVEVANCLAVRKGTTLEEITCVYSHPQALSQCSDFLKEAQLKIKDYDNTATAARMVAESEKPIAAICSERCAILNGLEILRTRISNVLPNYTRFICITKEMEVAPNADIVSVMMTLPNVPGSLSKLLMKFFLQGIDLVKIENRPIRDGSFDVMFYIDFKGNVHDRNIALFLTDLCKNCKDFKLLGNAVSF
jgi:chorismate mutase/prephenate dehydratase